MSSIKILAGDFPVGGGSISNNVVALPRVGEMRWAAHEYLKMAETLKSVEVASEDSVKRVGGTLGWGLAGVAVLGPVGLLAGLLLGGKGKDVTFVANFKDGRKMMATTDQQSFNKLQALVF
jgi:hypothetical protein